MRILKPMLVFTFAGLLLAGGCGSQGDDKAESTKAPATETPAVEKVFHVLSFEQSPQLRYLVHFDGPGAGATLFTGNEVHRLTPQVAASGSKYADDRLMVWIDGDEVLMEVDGKRVGPCQVSGLQAILAQAWLSGTDFWAVGNEPSWNLVMGSERVVLLTNQGQDSLEFPGLQSGQMAPRSPAGNYVFTSGTHRLEIDIIDELCTNIMSGEPFAASVRLILDGEEMTGCGTGLF